MISTMNHKDKLELFLSLRDFDEYMERFGDLAGLQSGSATFRKEMQLMETDSKYTHRRKDTLRRAKIRDIVTASEEEILRLKDVDRETGWWFNIDKKEPDAAEKQI